jgi:low temperature requirement protein LtrA
MAATRLILAAANAADGGFRDVLRGRLSVHYVVSAALFVVSIAVPEPFRYGLWLIAIAFESGALLREDRQAMERARREHDWSALAPANPGERLDAHHFAERFGLFLIILLGEVLVEAATATATDRSWGALIAAMILAAALWWLYFDAAAEINFRVLEISGGSPTLARSLFAVGHMLPAFSLLVIAAGVGLLLEGEPERIAYGLPAIGLGIYLAGTRVFMRASTRAGGAARVVLLLATFGLGRLHDVLGAHTYLWLLAAWAVMCATIASRTPARDVPVHRV